MSDGRRKQGGEGWKEATGFGGLVKWLSRKLNYLMWDKGHGNAEEANADLF
jgi:hypothetical protein